MRRDALATGKQRTVEIFSSSSSTAALSRCLRRFSVIRVILGQCTWSEANWTCPGRRSASRPRGFVGSITPILNGSFGGSVIWLLLNKETSHFSPKSNLLNKNTKLGGQETQRMTPQPVIQCMIDCENETRTLPTDRWPECAGGSTSPKSSSSATL